MWAFARTCIAGHTITHTRIRAHAVPRAYIDERYRTHKRMRGCTLYKLYPEIQRLAVAVGRLDNTVA